VLLYLALHSRRWASQWLLAQLWVYLSTVSTVCSANAGLDVRNLRIWQALAACGNGLCTGGCTCGPFPSDQTDLSQVPLPASNVGLGELAYDIFKYHMNSKLPLFRPTVKVLHRGASSFSAALVVSFQNILRTTCRTHHRLPIWCGRCLWYWYAIIQNSVSWPLTTFSIAAWGFPTVPSLVI